MMISLSLSAAATTADVRFIIYINNEISRKPCANTHLLLTMFFFLFSTPFIFANPFDTVESAFATYRNFLTGEAVQNAPSKIINTPSIKTLLRNFPLPSPQPLEPGF